MYTVDLIKAVVNSEHGWAVAEQFSDTFNGEKFEYANYNALRYIREVIEDILRSKVLSDKAQDELQEYRDNLEDYMVGAE
jgi:hypothetical protein